ncbi:hypothetical protein LOK49_LG01G03931 [Camellia lanceoleosa]|uniref:Uncharacterized protein n=1 Tax=Camellia lanceoleosa TaxID=1840588 RepID=A0ACC0ITV1_9ERIC|nr:hypothetical protein LOK49_LG01G03931 [Camellia lanceoleosa]
MRALQASTSSSYGVGISSFAAAAPRRLRLRHHHVLLAKVEPSDKESLPLLSRHYDDKTAEAGQGFWNCPCVPMRERKECHCMLFLTPDNDFVGKEQTISLEEIRESKAKM